MNYILVMLLKKKKVKDTGLLKYLETDPGKSMPAKNLLIGEKKIKASELIPFTTLEDELK